MGESEGFGFLIEVDFLIKLFIFEYTTDLLMIKIELLRSWELFNISVELFSIFPAIFISCLF